MPRPALFTADLQQQAIQLAGEGLPRKGIACELGVSTQTLWRALKRDPHFALELQHAEQAARLAPGRSLMVARLLRLLAEDLRTRTASEQAA